MESRTSPTTRSRRRRWRKSDVRARAPKHWKKITRRDWAHQLKKSSKLPLNKDFSGPRGFARKALVGHQFPFNTSLAIRADCLANLVLWNGREGRVRRVGPHWIVLGPLWPLSSLFLPESISLFLLLRFEPSINRDWLAETFSVAENLPPQVAALAA